jgi:hypothetical protein
VAGIFYPVKVKTKHQKTKKSECLLPLQPLPLSLAPWMALFILQKNPLSGLIVVYVLTLPVWPNDNITCPEKSNE